MSLKNFNRTDDMFSLCGLNCGLCGYRLQGHCNGCFKESFCAKTCPIAPCSVKLAVQLPANQMGKSGAYRDDLRMPQKDSGIVSKPYKS